MILKDVLTPNDVFILKGICIRKFYKIFYHPIKNLDFTFLSLFSFFKYPFCCGMVKQRNFLGAVDLLFDAKFLKYYPYYPFKAS